MPSPLRRFLRTERIVLLVLIVLFALSAFILLRRYYIDSTILVPAKGGTYIEGSVGELHPLMPWFTVENDVNRDIVSLVFAGLQKYNPQTGTIEDDLAEVTVSAGNRIYTARLKENLFWHDSTLEDPHPVSADDVLFTFKSIQDPEFPNTLLKQNFLGVTIDKIDDRTVRFTLEEPYRFFGSNLTLGLLPERPFLGVPVSSFDQVLDFGYGPIGAGPYAFRGTVQTDLSTEVNLERFERAMDEYYHLQSIVFRVFPDFPSLLSDIRNLDGVRLVPSDEDGNPVIPRSFTTAQYALPQYVALFLNMESEYLSDPNLRLGLQLGTDKQAIAESVQNAKIVDTPLLEIDTSDWRYQFDLEASQGALFDSDWNLPAKVRLQRLLELRDANILGSLQTEPIVYLDTGASLIITGSLLDVSLSAEVHDLPIEQSGSGSWQVALPTHGGTGSLNLGFNKIQLSDGGAVVDTFYLWRTAKSRDYKLALRENQLMEQFVASRDEQRTGDDHVSVSDLYLDKGFLRRRLSTDPPDIRINGNGDKLSLRLLTSASPPHYREIAEQIQQQWRTLGVHVGIVVPESRKQFEDALIRRNYDILLFGQSLLDNLDSYPYWHSSGTQQFTDAEGDLKIDAYNLSQYTSLEADSLLERVRKTSNEEEQRTSLSELRTVLKRDVPAVILYSPLYSFGYTRELQGVTLGSPSLHSDRFLTLQEWYLKEDRVFRSGRSWMKFPLWLVGLLR